jgi:hypothetical protein
MAESYVKVSLVVARPKGNYQLVQIRYLRTYSGRVTHLHRTIYVQVYKAAKTSVQEDMDVSAVVYLIFFI